MLSRLWNLDATQRTLIKISEYNASALTRCNTAHRFWRLWNDRRPTRKTVGRKTFSIRYPTYFRPVSPSIFPASNTSERRAPPSSPAHLAPGRRGPVAISGWRERGIARIYAGPIRRDGSRLPSQRISWDGPNSAGHCIDWKDAGEGQHTRRGIPATGVWSERWLPAVPLSRPDRCRSRHKLRRECAARREPHLPDPVSFVTDSGRRAQAPPGCIALACRSRSSQYLPSQSTYRPRSWFFESTR